MNKEEFDTFISSEIDNLRSEIQRPGWTTWAIIGAAAALIWVLIGLVEEGKYALRAVAGTLAVIWLLDYSYSFIRTAVNPSVLSRSSERFTPTYVITSNRLAIILGTAQTLALVVIAGFLSSDLSGLAASLSIGSSAVLMCFSSTALVVSFVRIPVPAATKKTFTMIPLFIVALMLATVWYYVRLLFVSPGGTTVFDVRFALVTAAIFYLVSRLVIIPQGAITLNILTTVRRELFMGKIDLPTALHQTDIAITGMGVSDLLEDYVATLLSLYRDASAEFGKLLSIIGKLDRSASAERDTEERQLQEAYAVSIRKIRNIVTVEIPRAYKPLQWRLVLVDKLLRHSDDITALMEKLKEERNSLAIQSADVEAKYLALMQSRRS